MKVCDRVFRPIIVVLALMPMLQLAGCVVEWPISKEVYTTAERQVLPVAVSTDTQQIKPADVPLYKELGYSAWTIGPGTNYSLDPNDPRPYDKRVELAPGHTDVAGAARLLSFFTMSDIHIADKESPAQPLYAGWNAPYGAPDTAGSAYSPVVLSTTQVLDAAVQTVNALHKKTPFDFGISLGDDANNSQYNELRWFIDVLDGKVITPSSGAHDGACDIDYQMPFKAAGLDKDIPWYQAIGNHDQFWMGSAYEDIKTMQAHVGNTVLNMENNQVPTPDGIDGYGFYMGVVDGTTPYGVVIKGGPEENFDIPPTVVADPDRHTLATATSSSLNWMKEFFNTTSQPVGHGFTQDNIDADFACYSFEPRSDIPLKIIVLDDTCKGEGQADYAAGCLDATREAWLKNELAEGQNNGQLMIVAAHIPILPQTSLNNPAITPVSAMDAGQLLTDIHAYSNLILWISGHRHVNVVTPQPYDQSDPTQGPENSFWEVETSSLRDFPQQFRTFDIRRNTDNTISIFVTDVDPAVREGSPAGKSRDYAVGAARIFAATPESIADTTSHAYNAELVKMLNKDMQGIIASYGTPLE